MRLSGVLLDFYDDVGGVLLKEAHPTVETLPAAIKTAHILSSEEREVLRDEAYALVVRDDTGRTFRKFACVDPGNTALSLLYFEKTAEHLPLEAVQVAANNLKHFCEEFNLPPTNLVKVAAESKEAAVLKRRRDPEKSYGPLEDSDFYQRTNYNSVQGGADTGKTLEIASQIKTSHINTIVDVAGQRPELRVAVKTASVYALGSRYPLDSYMDVQAAVRYFSECWPEMAPKDRHEFAVKTAARADTLGIPVSEKLARYGSTEYAPDVEAHLLSRQSFAPPEFREVYQRLREKRASAAPEVFAQTLAEVDQKAHLAHHWGGPVSDPWYATFGGRSPQQKLAEWSWQGKMGDSVNATQLKKLAADKAALGEKFASDLVEAFSQDPVTIFSSLPETHKTILSRMAVGA